MFPFIIFLVIFFISVLAITEFSVVTSIDISNLDDSLNVEEFYKLGHDNDITS